MGIGVAEQQYRLEEHEARAPYGWRSPKPRQHHFGHHRLHQKHQACAQEQRSRESWQHNCARRKPYACERLSLQIGPPIICGPKRPDSWLIKWPTTNLSEECCECVSAMASSYPVGLGADEIRSVTRNYGDVGSAPQGNSACIKAMCWILGDCRQSLSVSDGAGPMRAYRGRCLLRHETRLADKIRRLSPAGLADNGRRRWVRRPPPPRSRCGQAT